MTGPSWSRGPQPQPLLHRVSWGLDFVCNICSTSNAGVEKFGREVENCPGCHSSVRVRALLAALSQELFGAPLKLADFPVLKTIRGIGLSDAESYARILADRFDYRNTYLDRPPRLDIGAPDPGEFGTLDFLLAGEVFEHVRPPVEGTFRNAASLLRPGGVLIMTVPYKPAGVTEEHYPDLHDYGAVALRGGSVLVNRTASGELQVFENLVFHGGAGSTLELRRFSESGLRQALAGAGFEFVRIHAEDYPQYGIVHDESWSLPIGARRGPPDEGRERFSELAERHRLELERGRELRSDLERHRQWVTRLQEDLARAEAAIRVEQEASQKLHAELVDRSAWAGDLDRELQNQIQELRDLTGELEARTTWALSLESELKEKTNWAVSLDAEVRTRTDWARDLERQLAERTEWALQLDRRIKSLEADLQQTRSSAWHRVGRLLRLAR